MEITRLISDSNPNSVKNQRHSSLPQILSHINTTSTLHYSHKGHLTTTTQPPLIQHTQQQPQSPTHGHVHRILSPVTPSQQPTHSMLQASMAISSIPLHHQQIAPTPQSTQIPLSMDLQPLPPQQSQTHTPPNRRIAHILSEQKRRENINSGFEELKSIVPNCRGCADSKAVILRKAVHYIQTLESELQKLKQPGNSPTTPNTQTTPLTSPVMSAKSVHNTNGNLSLPPISSTLQAPPPQTQMPIHGNASGSSVYALSDYNQRLSDEKNAHQAELMVEQKPQQYASQWQSNRINYQNYNNHEPSSHQSNYQNRQSYQQHSYNHQKSLVHPTPRHHNQYYNENLKSENQSWNSAGEVGGNNYNYYCS